MDLELLIIIYLSVGFIYALYILLFAGDTWLDFPVNMALGPIYILMVAWRGLSLKQKPSYKDIFFGKKVAVFDLDGTIIETAVYWDEAFAVVKREIGISYVPNDFSGGLGVAACWQKLLNSRYLSKDFKSEFTIEQLVEKTDLAFIKILKDVEEELEPTEGFWSLAADLKENGFRLALASNSNKAVIDAVINLLGMQNVFEYVIGGDEVKKKKPHPEMYLKVAKALGVKPKDCVVFEDSVVGTKASCEAKMNTVVVWNAVIDQDVYDSRVMLFIHDFSELPDNLYKTHKDLLQESTANFAE